MIRELDTVVLVHDLNAYGLTQGDVGAVVHCYKDGVTFEVEFVTGEGTTIAVLTLSQPDIRPSQNCPLGSPSLPSSRRVERCLSVAAFASPLRLTRPV